MRMGPKSGNFRSDYGRSRGRRDMERIGLFEECSYLIGTPWAPLITSSERGKGMQMITNGPKTKTGLQDCYFEKTRFKSLSEKDPYVAMQQLERRKAMAEAKKNRTAQFWPPGGSKKSTTPGDFFGTFGGRINAMSPEIRRKDARKPEPPNVKTNPAKKGTYGYPDITINKFPDFKAEGPEPSIKRGETGDKLSRGPFLGNFYTRSYFDDNPFRPYGPSGSLYVKRRKAGDTDAKKTGQHWYPPHVPKWPANNHDGCFSEFPKYMPEPYGGKVKVSSAGGKSSGIFYPPIHGSDIRNFTESIVNLNADFRVHQKNWRYAKPFTFKDEAVSHPS